jgi:hypothetical protein
MIGGVCVLIFRRGAQKATSKSDRKADISSTLNFFAIGNIVKKTHMQAQEIPMSVLINGKKYTSMVKKPPHAAPAASIAYTALVRMLCVSDPNRLPEKMRELSLKKPRKIYINICTLYKINIKYSKTKCL